MPYPDVPFSIRPARSSKTNTVLLNTRKTYLGAEGGETPADCGASDHGTTSRALRLENW